MLKAFQCSEAISLEMQLHYLTDYKIALKCFHTQYNNAFQRFHLGERRVLNNFILCQCFYKDPIFDLIYSRY